MAGGARYVTLNTRISYARHFHILFSEAVERGWCVENPVAKLKRNSEAPGDPENLVPCPARSISRRGYEVRTRAGRRLGHQSLRRRPHSRTSPIALGEDFQQQDSNCRQERQDSTFTWNSYPFGTYRYHATRSEYETSYEMGNTPAVILAWYRSVAVEDRHVRQWWRLAPGRHNISESRPSP